MTAETFQQIKSPSPFCLPSAKLHERLKTESSSVGRKDTTLVVPTRSTKTKRKKRDKKRFLRESDTEREGSARTDAPSHTHTHTPHTDTHTHTRTHTHTHRTHTHTHTHFTYMSAYSYTPENTQRQTDRGCNFSCFNSSQFLSDGGRRRGG